MRGSAQPLSGRADPRLLFQVLSATDVSPEFLGELTDYETGIFGRGALNEWTFPAFIRNGRVCLVRDSDGIAAVAELMRCWNNSDEAYLISISVRRDLRCQGIGSSLLNGILSDLKTEGFQAISLTVDPKNTDAIRLYKKFRFVFKKPFVDEYGEGEDRYSMRLEL